MKIDNKYIKEVKDKMFDVLSIQDITLLIIIGTLAAIVYALRVLVLMERRIARIEMHIERVVDRLLKEELKIEKMIKKRRK